MRSAPFSIEARDGAARAGVIHTAHGDVRTPAFVPLASTATVKSLHAAEVAALGFDMVLGNTFHLFVQPGEELVADMGGLHEFMGWRRPIITDSGGYQVFSMGHGSVAEEIKRRRDRPRSMIVSIEEEGVRFRSYLDGAERFMGPETSMAVQAKLGSDIALAFDECTPFHVEREYTARSMERTHRWLERCLSWHAEHGPPGQLVYGIVQGGVYEDLRAQSTRLRGRRRRGRDRDRRLAGPVQGADARGGGLGAARACPTRRRATCSASATWTTSCTRWPPGSTPSTAPRPRAWRGTARRSCTTRSGAGGSTSRAARERRSREPIDPACPCPACREHTRGYIHYLVRANELTAKRLLTLHNLTFMAELMRGMRAAIAAGELAEHSRRLLQGYHSAEAAFDN